MLPDLFEKWEIVSHGKWWTVQTESGEPIADDIPRGSLALYIANLHNKRVDSMLEELYDL